MSNAGKCIKKFCLDRTLCENNCGSLNGISKGKIRLKSNDSIIQCNLDTVISMSMPQLRCGGKAAVKVCVVMCDIGVLASSNPQN